MASVNPVTSGLAKALGAITKSKPVRALTKTFQENPEGALAATTVTSIVIKDGIGCYKYVTQSLNNKEIPEDKRAFVASMDLTNGSLMIGTQIAMFYLMRKYSAPMFNKLFKKSFNPKAKRDMLTWLRMEAKKLGQAQPKKNVVEKIFEEKRKEGLDLFKFIFDVGIATIIGKRIITPFIATPLAGIVQQKFFPLDKDKENVDLEEQFEDKVDEIKDSIEDKVENKIDSVKNKIENKVDNVKEAYKKEDVEGKEEDDD